MHIRITIHIWYRKLLTIMKSLSSASSTVFDANQVKIATTQYLLHCYKLNIGT